METVAKKTGRTVGGRTAGAFFVAFAFAVCRAMAAHHPASIHDQLVEAAAKASLPQKLDEDTTLTGERVDGMIVINTYELSGERDAGLITAADRRDSQTALTKGVCSDSVTHNLVAKGVTYRFEYLNKGNFIVSVDVSSCPGQTSASVTSSPTAATDSVPVVLDGARALVPLTVGSQSIYATVDTGCSDMTVNESLANKLLALGEATEIGTYNATLADGTIKPMRNIRINNVTIGGHGVYSATAMVVPDGTMMLLGYNVLRQVSGKFAINTAKSTLDFD
jgi:hypothetical protein